MAESAMPMQCVRVVTSATCGRGLVFTSNFARGRCILEELPYVYTLFDNKRGHYCDFCLQKCSTLKKCSSCNYVSYCNKSCQRGDWARCHKQDCKTLKRRHPMIPPDLAESVQLLSHIIQKQRRSPPCTQDDEDCFPTTVDQLESHHEKLSGQIRRDAFEIWLSLLKDCEDGILPELSSWLKMFGATICNSISVCDNDLIDIAVGIYLRASMLNHSCDPNCAWVCDGRKLQIMTVKDVKEGDECTISYVDAMKPAKVRQADLKESYHFTCKCVKCIEEINALGPDDGLGEELRGLKKSLERIKDAEKAQDILLLQLCAPYLKPMDYSSNIPANHHLLYQVRNAAFLACIDSQAWQKAVETGQLNIEPNR
ncbi:histone-lysine N-methyltransferase SMYD3-like [Strongylocentrotus purpuratus]|uniref:Uncharacterized protein n=1 Tax=Strongylocentrotus purpuratus TaxID=7668 RepID=A0A7M7PLL1_STRPU|nr:histone-lysine N-methyltransferase SMYD3-like [Strongylocentrotus purpuratus]XP_030853048.1 histone-lysine N-methyltransferase SMYD3-like [Strongylocentrotus purpuratus]